MTPIDVARVNINNKLLSIMLRVALCLPSGNVQHELQCPSPLCFPGKQRKTNKENPQKMGDLCTNSYLPPKSPVSAEPSLCYEKLDHFGAFIGLFLFSFCSKVAFGGGGYA